ncbi:hypothetical protein [Pararhodobacter sp. SW119]|uniref:hypothetical protein n=1 Tax=Pararhodobacter sp. SW119 TaxID=2780075 RepID=UPI001ADEE3C9|nr:hypothetical protein [Pararhodobacter sp. SW119]
MSFDPALILSCLREVWVWRLGDNHLLGWSLTAGYGAAAVLAGVVAARAPFPGDTRLRERVFWVLVTLFLLFLMVNKQLNLQTTFTGTGRCVARAEGWYRARRGVQEQFILAMVWVLGTLGLIVLWWLRRALVRNLFAVAGGAVLAGFIVIRAASMHQMDSALRTEFLSLRAHRWIEVAGITLMLIGAVLALRRARRRR